MPFADQMLGQKRPDRIRAVVLPSQPGGYHPSPSDWRDEVLYFLLPDRFSDGKEDSRPLLNRNQLSQARPSLPDGTPWRWDNWAESGKSRWQGGTISGLKSKLTYLKQLGITTVWIGPVFKQRGTLDTFHGYGIQDFLEVDSRFGTRKDLVELVKSAHGLRMRIILDIIFNHSGRNWDYQVDGQTQEMPRFLPWPGHYPNIRWLGPNEQPVPADPVGPEDGVWPIELQKAEWYTRAGNGDLGGGGLDDSHAEHKRTDFFALRDFSFDPPSIGAASETLDLLAACYKYWIALTDCDGFRLDTVKHVDFEEARNFCGAIKEFAAGLGKHDFFLVAEVAGGDFNQDRYLDVLGQNLNAALDIGDMRPALGMVSKGLAAAEQYFRGFDPGDVQMGSHRNIGLRHVSILDDHDHVTGDKIRFSSEAASDHQVVAAVALQLFTLGIPCIYYGTEQAFSGPEQSERRYLPAWNARSDFADRYLREAMFGPGHPRQDPSKGLQAQLTQQDDKLFGFGPFGTAGAHCFDKGSPAFIRIAALTALRKKHAVLRIGRQYQRQVSNFGAAFSMPASGEIIAWSRLLDVREALCIINGHGLEARGGDVVVDASLNTSGVKFTVVANTAETAAGTAYNGTHRVGETLDVKRRNDGTAYVEIRSVGPSETLVLHNGS